DVYTRHVRFVRLLHFFLFMLFFPRVIAGPIVRYEEVMPQLLDTKPRKFMMTAAAAACLFSIGLFKKSVIADSVSRFVPFAFQAPWNEPPTLLNAWMGVLAYTFQLYFDFSGYSDMAMAVALMLGVR